MGIERCPHCGKELLTGGKRLPGYSGWGRKVVRVAPGQRLVVYGPFMKKGKKGRRG